MELLLIRHGETEADILRVHEGHADFELTERCHFQAEAMSRYISQNYSIDKIYHSTLKRAAQTAQNLALATSAPLPTEGNLMEFNNGLIAGLEFDVAAEKYPRVDVPMHTAVTNKRRSLISDIELNLCFPSFKKWFTPARVHDCNLRIWPRIKAIEYFAKRRCH